MACRRVCFFWDIAQIYPNERSCQTCKAPKSSETDLAYLKIYDFLKARIILGGLHFWAPCNTLQSNRGVNRDIINEQTGILASDDELGEAIKYVTTHHDAYKPRKWAIRNSGSINAWKTLNAAFLELERFRIGKTVTNLCMIKSNPNLVYADEGDRISLEPEYHRL